MQYFYANVIAQQAIGYYPIDQPSTSNGYYSQVLYYPQQVQYLGYDCVVYQPCQIAEEVYYDSGVSSASSSDGENCIYPIEIDGTVFYADPMLSLQDTEFSKSYKSVKDMSPSEIYAHLLKYMKTSIPALKIAGYPHYANDNTSKAVINATEFNYMKKMWLAEDEKMRKCCRCNEEFELSKNEEGGECHYHSRNAKFNEATNKWIHECCGKEKGSPECKTSSKHVFDQYYASELEKFVQSPLPNGKMDPRSKAIFAIDCEMVHTNDGPALARLSVVNWDGNLVLDVFVKPPSEVIDPNTEFSGLTMDQVNGATKTLESARSKLLELVNSETLLIGHSLESDLRALRLVHYNIVDTAILFKKRKYKPALRKLALELLGLSIQSNNANQLGHDSEEDARVCIELLKYRINYM